MTLELLQVLAWTPGPGPPNYEPGTVTVTRGNEPDAEAVECPYMGLIDPLPGVQPCWVDTSGASWVAVATYVDGVAATAGAGGGGTGKLLGYGSSTTEVTLSPTAGVYSNLVTVANVDVVAGRYYRCTMAGGHSFVTGGSGFTVGDFWEFTIERDVNNSGVWGQLPGAPIILRVRANVAVAARFPVPVLVGWYLPTGAASVDFRARAAKGGGASTVTTDVQTATGSSPFTLTVEEYAAPP